MNYYPFHIGDYVAHTAHLDPLEDIAYRRMLDLYYQREGVLPVSEEEVARLVRMKGNVAEVKAVLVEFFVLTADGWSHARCDAEIAKMQDKQSKAKASADASVKARQANAQRTLNERLTGGELPTPTPTPKKETTPLPPSRGKSQPQGFKSWGKEELTASANAANHDGMLLESEVSEFIEYWTEPNSRGKPRFSLEKTWDTRRRMHTAFQVIYEKRRAPPTPKHQDVGQRVVSGAEQTRKYLNELYADGGG